MVYDAHRSIWERAVVQSVGKRSVNGLVFIWKRSATGWILAQIVAVIFGDIDERPMFLIAASDWFSRAQHIRLSNVLRMLIDQRIEFCANSFPSVKISASNVSILS